MSDTPRMGELIAAVVIAVISSPVWLSWEMRSERGWRFDDQQWMQLTCQLRQPARARLFGCDFRGK